MIYKVFHPPKSLSRIVRFFWVLESDETISFPYIYRSLADGCGEIVFHYKGAFKEIIQKQLHEHSLSLVNAQTKTYRRFVVNEPFGVLGVYFYPFATHQLFSLPTSELSDHLIDIKELWKDKGASLEEQIILAKCNYKRITILTKYLERIHRYNSVKDEKISDAILYLINNKGFLDINDFAEKYFLSRRQFERRFKENAGFSPKLYHRILRFQSTFKSYNLKEKTLGEIAYKYGYFDQSHFIREFKSFSGYSPKVFFNGLAEGTEYMNENPISG